MAKSSKKKGRGRPAYEPTEGERALVRKLLLSGITIEEIAELLKKAKGTIYKHFQEEIDETVPKAHAQIAGKIYQMAMAGDKTLLMFIAKTRLGWRETNNLDLTSKGESIQTVVNILPRQKDE
jgi:predicted transcriptional regulator